MANKQRVAVLAPERAARDRLAGDDLDVDLVVGGVDAGRVVERVGVDLAAGQRRLDAAALGEAEIGALADHARPHLVAVDAQRIAGAVAGVGMAFARGLHVGADAAEIEQVDRRRQDRPHQVDRRHGRRLDAQHRRAPRPTARSTWRRGRRCRRPPTSATCRSPSTTSAAGRTAACARPSSSPDRARDR